jgi:hypothetical protein
VHPFCADKDTPMTSYPAQQFRKDPPEPLTAEQLEARWWASYPEALGPAEEHDSGRAIFGQPTRARVGPVPHPSGFGPEQMWKERAEQEARAASVPPEVRAAEQLVREQMRAEGRRWF